jgi:hypothetical protein
MGTNSAASQCLIIRPFLAKISIKNQLNFTKSNCHIKFKIQQINGNWFVIPYSINYRKIEISKNRINRVMNQLFREHFEQIGIDLKF